MKDERFRITEKSGIIRDIVVTDTDDDFQEGLSCIVNLREANKNDMLCIMKYKYLKRDKTLKVEPLLEKPNFMKLQDLYSLFKNAKEVFLIATLTVYSDSSYFDSIEENYSFNIVYLRIDNLFTEIILSSRADVLTHDWGIDYVYVFQSEFEEDLSLSLFTHPVLHRKKFFNTKIQVKPLSKDALKKFLNNEDNFSFDMDIDIDWELPEDYIGVDLDKLIIYSFLSADSNLAWGSGLVSTNEVEWDECGWDE